MRLLLVPGRVEGDFGFTIHINAKGQHYSCTSQSQEKKVTMAAFFFLNLQLRYNYKILQKEGLRKTPRQTCAQFKVRSSYIFNVSQQHKIDCQD